MFIFWPKKKSLENKEFFEGDSIFTSRTINRAVKYINAKIVEKSSKGKNINLSNIIKVIIDKLYARPYIERGFINEGEKSNQLVFRENIIDIFAKEITSYSRTNSDNNFDDNKELLEQLRDIQIAVTESDPKKKFNFINFVSNSLNIKLKSLYFILRHIDSTLMIIHTTKTKLNSELLNNYCQISIISKLLNNIMKYGIAIGDKYNEMKLFNFDKKEQSKKSNKDKNDEEEKKIEEGNKNEELIDIEELKWPILRLLLLKSLLNDKDILPQILKREYTSQSTEEVDDI